MAAASSAQCWASTFTWFIGTALEREWGDFRYTVYLLSGMLGTVLACLLTGVSGSTYCLSLSLLLAFAMLYPEVQVLLFFVIPIRVKYFGFFAASTVGAELFGRSRCPQKAEPAAQHGEKQGKTPELRPPSSLRDASSPGAMLQAI